MKHYIDIPQTITYRDILDKDYSFSSNAYKQLIIKNKNTKTLRECLDRDLTRLDLGYEVGSLAYVKFSKYLFIKSKALQEHSFLPNFEKSAVECITSQSFVNMNLVENDIIISKDSNIGEVIVLDKNYPNAMLSSALYKLPITKHKYYILAMIKHDIFRQQLDFMVPKGATIRHAKTLFLNCKIPFPNHNVELSIKFIQTLTKSIIKKEALIKTRHEEILNLIESELLTHQLPHSFSYTYPTFKELQSSGRFDTGIYSKEFKSIEFMIKNYKNGYFYLDNENIKSGSTPETRDIGKDKFLKYQWITPSHCSDYGTIKEMERINFIGEPNLTQDCILISNATSKGKRGEYVGIATFYSHKNLGNAQYNQQLYKLTDTNTTKLLFILCFLNCKLIRTMCSYLCVGSKMKGMKKEHFLQIPFPNFPQNIQEKIATLYHNPNSHINYESLNLDNFTQSDDDFCKNAGIYDLDKSIKHLKKILNSSIDKIINDEKVNITFKA